MQRYGYLVSGQVQGVGFRPFVYRIARRHDLTGLVGNTSEGVRIEVQGSAATLAGFDRALREELPPLAHILDVQRFVLSVLPEEAAFQIVLSEGHHGHAVLVSPDVATCDQCLADLRDPKNRRYRYPFTNCTNCGPRYTITHAIPYDRATTSMACFPLCPECAHEYADPADRRFHAQPNACPACGPEIWLDAGELRGWDALTALAQALAGGAVAAVKGLGGFHLVCDAANPEAVTRLRVRKRRPHKALAIMVPDLDTARKVAQITPEEAACLLSPEHPAVIVERLEPCPLAPQLAPDVHDLGIMLPYTPLHHLLLAAFAEHASLPALVMTSGNAGGEPIALGNREARQRLGGIADHFLFHNRDILIRADDSVVRVASADGGTLHMYRRARGFVPRPLPMPLSGPCLLGVGAELKNTLCLTRGKLAFPSQHIGDLKNTETFSFFQEMVAHLSNLLEVRPEAVVCDCHPDYLSSVWARESGLPVVALQHHFAHIYSVLAEHDSSGPALGLALDGTGFGLDGTIWGGELLLVHPGAVHAPDTFGVRIGRLAPFPLPGGEAAIREPWRLAAGLLVQGDARGSVLGAQAAERASSLFTAPDSPVGRYALFPAIAELIQRGTPPLTSSCGRLFDAAAALLGLCPVITYEGQAAIRLEEAASWASTGHTEKVSPAILERNDLLELEVQDLFQPLVAGRLAGVPVPVLARRFQLSLVEGLADLALTAARKSGIRTVALSGGVLHNRTIIQLLPAALRRRGLSPLLHRLLPPGDGGLSFGQVAWARRIFQ